MQSQFLFVLTIAAFVTFTSPATSSPLITTIQDTDTFHKPWLLSEMNIAPVLKPVVKPDPPSSGMRSFYQSLYGQLSRQQPPVFVEPHYNPSKFRFMDTAFPSFPGPEEEEEEEEVEKSDEIISPHTRNLIARIMHRAALTEKRQNDKQ